MMRWISKTLGLLGGGWCVLMCLYLVVAPVGRGLQITLLTDGTQTREEFTTTLIQANPVSGPVVLTTAAILGIIAGWAAWTGRIRLLGLAAGLLLFGSILAGLSIGLAYLPAAGALVLAAVVAIVERRLT